MLSVPRRILRRWHFQIECMFAIFPGQGTRIFASSICHFYDGMSADIDRAKKGNIFYFHSGLNYNLVNHEHSIESPDANKISANMFIAVPNTQWFILCGGPFLELLTMRNGRRIDKGCMGHVNIYFFGNINTQSLVNRLVSDFPVLKNQYLPLKRYGRMSPCNLYSCRHDGLLPAS